MVGRKAKAKSRLAQAKPQKAIAGSNKARALSFSKAVVVRDVMFEAKALGISQGAAKAFAEKVAEKVVKWAERRESITEDDINMQIAREIAKYSKDLSFIYKNRGKII
jgi:histone H3/H4